jgi:hypothetical protein
MKVLVLLLVITTASFGIAAWDLSHKPIKVLSAVVTIQCNSILGVVFTYSDGSTVIVDAEHHAGFDNPDDVIAAVKVAPKHFVMPAACPGTGVAYKP